MHHAPARTLFMHIFFFFVWSDMCTVPVIPEWAPWAGKIYISAMNFTVGIKYEKNMSLLLKPKCQIVFNSHSRLFFYDVINV